MTKNQSKKILIIEDDNSQRKILKERLEIEGYSIEIARDGEEAIEKFSEFNPDMILLDIMIPKKSGIEVLKSIRDKENGDKIKVIIFSNIETFESISKCLEHNANQYYIKSNTSLDSIVKAVVDNLS